MGAPGHTSCGAPPLPISTFCYSAAALLLQQQDLMDRHGPKIYPADKASEVREAGERHCWGGLCHQVELSGFAIRELIPAAGEEEQHKLQRSSPALFSLRFLQIHRVHGCHKVASRFLTLLQPQNEGISAAAQRCGGTSMLGAEKLATRETQRRHASGGIARALRQSAEVMSVGLRRLAELGCTRMGASTQRGAPLPRALPHGRLHPSPGHGGNARGKPRRAPDPTRVSAGPRGTSLGSQRQPQQPWPAGRAAAAAPSTILWRRLRGGRGGRAGHPPSLLRIPRC